MDLVIWIWANVSQARMEGSTARADQDLSGTQLTNSPVGYLPPHSLTLRALFTLVPSECGPTAQARQRLPTTKLAAAAVVGGAKQTAKSLSLTRV